MTLALKLLLAPLLVVLSSLAGRRWGPSAAGLLVALPVVAGPILLITTLEHGRRFGATAAGASLLGLVTLALFACVADPGDRPGRHPAGHHRRNSPDAGVAPDPIDPARRPGGRTGLRPGRRPPARARRAVTNPNLDRPLTLSSGQSRLAGG